MLKKFPERSKRIYATSKWDSKLYRICKQLPGVIKADKGIFKEIFAFARLLSIDHSSVVSADLGMYTLQMYRCASLVL